MCFTERRPEDFSHHNMSGYDRKYLGYADMIKTAEKMKRRQIAGLLYWASSLTKLATLPGHGRWRPGLRSADSPQRACLASTQATACRRKPLQRPTSAGNPRRAHRRQEFP